jgi:hypothetical protein
LRKKAYASDLNGFQGRLHRRTGVTARAKCLET